MGDFDKRIVTSGNVCKIGAKKLKDMTVMSNNNSKSKLDLFIL